MGAPRKHPIIVRGTDLDWLLALDLFVEPFAADTPGLLGAMVLRAPPWVTACHALARLDPAPVSKGWRRDREVTARRTTWRGFLVFLTRDDVTRTAIDAVGRLGDEAAAAAFVAPLLARFEELMGAAPVCSRVQALQELRARRLDGRAARASDAAYAASREAAKPAPRSPDHRRRHDRPSPKKNRPPGA